MAYYGFSDIDEMLTEFGVDVSIGASPSFKAILDQADEEILSTLVAPLTGKVNMFTVKATSLGAAPAGVATGVQMTLHPLGVGGGSTHVYVIRDLRQVGDGALYQVFCTDVPS